MSARTSPAKAPFDLNVSAEVGQPYVRYLDTHLRIARTLIATCKLASLNIVITSAKSMARLHRDFLGIDSPTDVLTFEISHNRAGQPVEGEVYICLPVAKQNALQRKIAVQNELLLYALHGMLHLSGYDDIKPADYKKMHKTEDAILRRMKIGKVFAARAK